MNLRTPVSPWQAVHHWMRRSLSARIVLLFLGLLLIVQAASFVVTRVAIDRNARVAVQDDLDVGERLLRRTLEQNAQRLSEGATLLASDYGFRSAIGSNDDATISSVLANHGDRIGANVSALLDTQFKLRTAARADERTLEAMTRHLALRGVDPNRTASIVMIDNKPFQFVLVPLRAPVLVGWVLMGFPVDQRVMNEIRGLSSLHVSLQARRDVNSDWVTTLSTLPAEAMGALKKHSMAIEDGRSSSLTLPDGEYSVRTVLLTKPDEPAVSALLMRSVDEAVAPYRHLQISLGLLTLLGVTIIAIGSVFTARRVTTPLRSLVDAAERLGGGDYATPLSGTQRKDEIGELAQAFEHMRGNVAGQQEEILKLAYWDSLTGLPNRMQFRNALLEAIALAKADDRSVAVVMLDLDRFKHVNDVLGYRFGDLMLKGVAERLSQQAVRDGDLVARLGGDEFAVLLTDLERDSDIAHTRAVAQRLHQAFGDVMTLEDHTVDMSASFGMAVWPHQAADADTLLSRAEVAMYTAKRRGDGPVLYDAAIDASSAQTLSLLGELRHALDHNELRLYLQPKLGLDGGRVLGAEALLRWEHPQRGLLPPMSFIPFAEQTGFVRQLTMWVFEESARMWRVFNESGLRLVMSINLSTRDLMDLDLPQKIEALLLKHIVPAEAFCLEITESAIMDDPQRALGTLERLSAMGFRLSIDDFGTGYSSLAYLKRLPVDELKIDKSFVLNMEKDLNDARIVRSTIDLAHGLGLSVVAEGVESRQVWDLLRELSCDEAQGFYMSRPIPAGEFMAWANSWAQRHAGATMRGSFEASVTLH